MRAPRAVAHFECVNPDGSLAWDDRASNLVTESGGVYLLQTFFKGGGYTAAWYCGLIGATGYTTGPAVGDTAGSHAGWAEATGYEAATRPAITFADATSGGIESSAAVDFVMTAGATIKGFIVASAAAKGGTSGVVYSAALFDSGDKALLQGQTLRVNRIEYTLTAQTAPANATAPTVSGTAEVGQDLTYTAGTWQGTPSVRAWWRLKPYGSSTWVRIARAYAGTPYRVTIRDAHGVIDVEEVATDGALSTSVSSTQTAAVTQPSGTIYVARESYGVGISALSNIIGTPPLPVGTMNYGGTNMQRLAGGAIAVGSGADWDQGEAHLVIGADKQVHAINIANAQHAFFHDLFFGCSAWIPYEGGAESGYRLRFNYASNVPTNDWEYSLTRFDGGGHAGAQIASGTIANGMTSLGIAINASASNALALTISRSNGADIPISITGETSPHRGGTIGIKVLGRASGTAAYTFDAGQTSAEVLSQANAYTLAFNEDFVSDPLLARFSFTGAAQPGHIVWKDHAQFDVNTVINGEYQRWGSQSLGINLLAITDDGLVATTREATVGERSAYTWSSQNTTSGKYPLSWEITQEKGFNFQYGYMEARAKFPVGTGFWPAFWTLGRSVWPPEHDVFEMSGTRPTQLHCATHVQTDDAGTLGGVASGWLNLPAGWRIDEMHTYAMRWTPTTIYYYVDGRQVFSTPNTINQRVYPKLNVAVGSSFGSTWIPAPDGTTPTPVTSTVEFIRVWTSAGEQSKRPTFTTLPTASVTGSGIGAVVTIVPGVSNAASVQRFCRRGVAKITGTDNATTYTTVAGDMSVSWNYFERHTMADGTVEEVFAYFADGGDGTGGFWRWFS